MNQNSTDFSKEQLLDRLVDAIRAANHLKLDDLAYDLSVAVTEERLRDEASQLPHSPSGFSPEDDTVVQFPASSAV